MSKLDAINEMLFNSGEQIVTSLTDVQNTDIKLAENLLDQTTLEIQLRGMHANRRPVKVKPSRTGPTGNAIRPISDSTKGRIRLSDYTDNLTTGSLISAELITEVLDAGTDTRVNAVPRKFGIESNGTDYNVLYNVTAQTDEWELDKELTLSLVEYVEFKDLETTVQKSISVQASRQYQMFVQGDKAVDMLLAERSAMFSAKGRAADINDKNRNIFSSGDSAILRAVNRGVSGVYDPSRFRFWRGRMHG